MNVREEPEMKVIGYMETKSLKLIFHAPVHPTEESERMQQEFARALIDIVRPKIQASCVHK